MDSQFCFEWDVPIVTSNVCPHCRGPLLLRDSFDNIITDGNIYDIKDMVCPRCKMRFLLNWTSDNTFRALRTSEYVAFLREMRDISRQ